MRSGLIPALGLLAALSQTAAAQAPLAAQGCLGCHGVGGAGAGGTPGIAGRDAGEIAAIMHAFRDNQRPGTIMGRIARGYTEAEIAAISAYFAGAR